MDAKKLSNMSRYILKTGKLSDPELELIKEKFRNNNNSIPETRTTPTPTTAAETYAPTTQINVPHGTQHQQDCQEDPDIVELSTNILRRLECVKETKIEDRQTIPKIRVHRAATKIIRLANESLRYIKAKRESPMTLSETNELIYATAATITETLGTQISTRKKKKRPSWKVNLENDIKKLRSQLSGLSEIEKDSQMKQQKKNKIKRQLKIKTKEDIPKAKEILKQRIQAKSQRLRRLTKHSNFFWHNKLFREDTKKLYRELNKNKIVVHSPPTINEIEDFLERNLGNRQNP